MVLCEMGPATAPDLDFGPDYPGPYDGGVVEVGEEATITVPLSNLGGSELVISELNLAEESQFTILSPAVLPVSLAPEETVDLEIGFRPEQVGRASERVHIVSNDPSRDGACFVPLAGVGAADAEPRLTARAELAFGQVPVGGASELMLELSNDGGRDLALSASLASDDFSLAGLVPATLTPGERALLPVRLSPGTAGELNAILNLHSNDPTNLDHPVALSGEGLASARIGVEPSLLDLGVVEGQGQAVLQISNQGGAELVISAVEVDPPFSANAPPLPALLPPGASLEVELRLEDSVSGLHRAAVRVLSNDPVLPWAVVPVHAHAAAGRTWVLDFPAVARTPGLEDAQWFSDAVLLNPSDEPAAVDLVFLPHGGDNGQAGAFSYSVSARQQRLVRDVVSALGQTGAGGLEVHTTSPDVIGVSRTYSADEDRSFGQHIAAVAREEALVDGHQYLLPGLAGNDGFHTNLGVLNLGEGATTVAFEVYGPSGVLLGTVTVTAAARGFAQTTSAIAPLTGDAIRGGYAILSGGDAGARFLAYASVVDDSSHDPTFISPTPLDAALAPLESIVQVVASNSGLNDTWWRSEVSVVNLGGSAADVTLELNPAGGGEPSTVVITVGGGEARFLPDVVSTTFGGSGTGWLRLSSEATGLHVSSRTFNDDPDGTYGQLVPAVGVSELFTFDDVVVLPGLRSADGFRTNLGVTSLAEVPTELEVVVIGADGVDVGTLRVALASNSFVQVGRLLQDQLGIYGWAWATLSSTDPEAAYTAHASVVDGTTGDPAFIPAVAMPE